MIISREESKTREFAQKHGLAISDMGLEKGLFLLLDELYDSFEKQLEEIQSRSCKECEFYGGQMYQNVYCNLLEENIKDTPIPENFSCRKWEKKDATWCELV